MNETQFNLIGNKSSPVSSVGAKNTVMKSPQLFSSGEKSSSVSSLDEVKRSPKIPKEEVRMIAAKDLAEDRKLEKRRLNKLLTIFDDQKPVK